MAVGFYIILEESIMTTYLTPVKEIERKWFVVDAQSLVLGRLAAEIATRLRGKHKPNYSTFQDVGDFVVVVNAEKVRLTGRKLDNKIYYHHSGYLGGMKECTAQELLVKAPEEIIFRAVRGMLPKNTLGRAQLKKLKVYAGENHPHDSQQPEEIKL
jgi:large subunit ribosomal protein L13